MFSPFGHRRSFAAVLRLFLRSRPSTVLLAVVPIIINSVYGSTLRAFPHIPKEILERITPLIADRNIASAPILKPNSIGIIASLFHSSPRVVSWAFMSMSMLKSAFRCFLISQASTRQRSTDAEVVLPDFFYFTAFTSANPEPISIRSLKNGPSSNFLAC